MGELLAFPFAPALGIAKPSRSRSVLVGITSAQTCIIMGPHLRALRRAGFQVTLVSSPGELLDRIVANEGVNCASIPMRRTIAPAADLIALVKIWRLMGRLKPHMVEFGTPKAGLLGMLAAAVRGVPWRVYHLRGLKLETAHGWKRRLLLVTERLACACAHVVLCNSASLRARVLELGLAPAKKLRILGEGSSIGVDIRRFSPGPSKVRERFGWKSDTPVIGFVGRLTRDKGLPELVDAFDQILKVEPEAQLLLVGWFDAAEDALDASMRARIQIHPQIHFTGYVQDPAPYYRAMDVMALPTWREGFPNAVLEAQASGVPVVTTTATGARDSIMPEVTGLLIPPGHPTAIAEAVLKLLRDPARRQRMGKEARDWVLAHYMEQRVARLTEEFYSEASANLDWAQATPRVGSVTAAL